MPTPPTTPTAAPTPPDRADRATFSARATASFDHLKNHAIPELAALAENAYDNALEAEAAAVSAVAAANYKGVYSAGTTYQVGQSVTYGSARWYAKTINTGVTPVDGANWGLVNEIPSPTGQDGKSLRSIGGVPVWSVVADIQEFSSSGTWTKPAGCTFVLIELLGAGGGGGSGYLNYAGLARGGGGGGGGGALISKVFKAADLGATESVTIGAGGSGAAGRTGTTGSGSSGSDGGNTTVGSLLTAYGGKGGMFGADSTVQARGHGASSVPQSSAPPQATDALPNGIGTFGGYCSTSNNPGCAEYGGAAGAPTNGPGARGLGGGSLYGGAGGGGGAGLNTSNTSTGVGGAGGLCGAYTGGGGASQGATAATGTAGTAGAAPSGAKLAGGGGGGGGAGTTGNGGAGGAGGRGSGGGGGGAGTEVANTSGAGGAGGAGFARITAW